MATRTVRLDAESELALAEIRRRTGASVSLALKQGLIALQDRVRQTDRPTFGEVYRTLDLGSGGYLDGSARDAKALARAAIARKHRR
jgi:hypothetical protein